MTSMVFAGRYVATGEVFKGGGGVVYICDDPNLERRVVIKFLLPGVDVDRLHDEVLALQAIRSPNVVQILDLVDDSSLKCGIVAEHLPGVDLTEDGAIELNRESLLRLIFALANGLSDIHAAGIVHRDIKPNNIKFGDENILKIFDFNLARDTARTETDGFRGSHGFAAPELYGTGTIRFTDAVDVYALGATVAYVMLEGALPGPLLRRPPRPSEWTDGFDSIDDLDADLAALLNRSLSHRPAERPNASEIRDHARKLLLHNAHRAMLQVLGEGKLYELSATNKRAKLDYSKWGGGSLEIEYNGHDFVVSSATAQILVNHSPCTVGHTLPHSCVIELGSRQFVTYDLAHPEVVQ